MFKDIKLQSSQRFWYRYVTVTLTRLYLTDTKINVHFRNYNFLKRFITPFNDL